jgi:hypothetical protein
MIGWEGEKGTRGERRWEGKEGREGREERKRVGDKRRREEGMKHEGEKGRMKGWGGNRRERKEGIKGGREGEGKRIGVKMGIGWMR